MIDGKKVNDAVRNGSEFRDIVHRLLNAWIKRNGAVRSEERNVYRKVTGEMCRCDLFIVEGTMQWPFDGPIAIECKSQKSSGSAHERICSDYLNALLRSPMCTLFVTDSEIYRPFCDFVTSYEASMLRKVLGSQHIWAVNGLSHQGLLGWFESNRKKLFD